MLFYWQLEAKEVNKTMNQIKIICLAILFLVPINILKASNKTDVSSILDQLHLYASQAKSTQYFSLFTDEAIFIGTDATENWTMKEFKAFAIPYFSKGKGWTYTSNNRHIYFSKSKNTAWFDEMLFNENYGETRGTGVLIRSESGWKIEQYHLTFPIPNELSEQVVKIIKSNQYNKKP